MSTYYAYIRSVDFAQNRNIVNEAEKILLSNVGWCASAVVTKRYDHCCDAVILKVSFDSSKWTGR